jgi:hypothetical protein
VPSTDVGNGVTNPIEVATLSTEVRMAIALHRADPLAHPALVGGDGGDTRELLAIVDGQTVFTLESIPTLPQLSRLFLNGVKATYASHYTVNAAQLTWLGIALSDDDELEIFYR